MCEHDIQVCVCVCVCVCGVNEDANYFNKGFVKDKVEFHHLFTS